MHTTRVTFAAIFIVVYGAAVGYACSKDDDEGSSPGDGWGEGYTGPRPGAGKPKAPKWLVAKATIEPTSDASQVKGTVEFIETKEETLVNVTIKNGGFPSSHGLHIYENGSCAATDAGPGLAAGEHWNPTGKAHGHPTAEEHHVGDLGNIQIDHTGHGSQSLSSEEFYVREGPLSVVGRSVIFHGWPDDGQSPDDGNSGPRLGCGVIELEGEREAEPLVRDQ